MDKVKKISEFPAAESFNADDLLFSEQGGRARSLSGEVLQAFCRAAVDALVERAETAADDAEAARAAISALQVTASTLAAGESATASVELTEDRFLISFGIPAGATGAPGAFIRSIERTAGNGTSGETDTYTITLTDGSKTTFQVYNGKDGSITFEDLTEEQRESLRGPEGPAGPAGPVGPAGYTPVRGTDYWTEEDKQEILDEVAESGAGGGMFASIFVTGLSEADTVSASNGEKIKTAVWNGEANRHEITKIGDAGMWTVTGTKDGYTDTKTVLVDAAAEYEISLFDVFGISRDITNSSPAWARTDMAVGMSATASVGTVSGSSDFDGVMPWAGIKRETLSTGDVMVKIPKFWFQRYREGNVERIRIADKGTPGFTLHPAFKHSGVECDHIYVGAYKTSSNNKSVTGAAPQASQTRATMRSNAKNKGTGWSLIDISALSAIQMLMLVEFADNNMQSKIGRGYCDGNSAAINTGSCDSVPNLTGRPSGTDGTVDVIWRGIEGFWGNIWELVDGVNFNGGKYYVCNDQSKYADDTVSGYEELSFTGAANWASSYITQEGLDRGNNTHVMLPTAAGSGSETTYECDACWSNTGWRVCLHGGSWDNGSKCGLFTTYLYRASSYSDAYIGSRLLYIPAQ